MFIIKKYKNHIIRKRFGQNFLVDKKIIESIINIIQPKYNDQILEIGPGFGALTEYFCKKNKKSVICY